MNKSVILSFSVMVLFALDMFVTPLSAEAQNSSSRRRTTRTTTRSSSSDQQTYNVVQIGDSYRVLTASSMKEEKKRLDEQHKEKIKEWEDTRKIDPDTPKPVKLTIKTLKSGFKTQKVANDYVTILRKEDEEADRKKGKKKGGSSTARTTGSPSDSGASGTSGSSGTPAPPPGFRMPGMGR